MQAYRVREAMEFALLLVGLAVMHVSVGVPIWLWIALPATKLISSVVFYSLFLRRVFAQRERFGEATWVGGVARTLTPLSPQGHVRIHGETWCAVSRSGEWLPASLPVVVSEVKDRVLGVERLPKNEGLTDGERPSGATHSTKTS